MDLNRAPTDDLAALRRMLLVRAFEERLAELSKQQLLPGFVHLSIGQEAVAVGACGSLAASDRITSTHRGHGHALAKGCEPGPMFAELMGREGGYCRGRGGSMHLLSLEHGVLGTNGIVGGGIPIAVGSALTSAVMGDGGVTIAFFGDGAANEGVLSESLNMAAIWRLPVVFVCENNGFAEWSATDELTAGRIVDRGTPFGVPSTRVDGNDLRAVQDVVGGACERARGGDGPSLVEAVTYRTHGHLIGEEAFTSPYRTDDEVAAWRERDPIALFAAQLVAAGQMGDATLGELRAEVEAELDSALAWAQASPLPDPDEAELGVLVEGVA
ncbi:MAG TPA: thiamine pyrophosphate-dependent dehydrogenase E1 component subunit alpha [Conexibacter sp.]|nr:thiamine pyrophosphate-dependent dehydrogenase E1 component subunit alpha [Conexibacter sp.]